MCVAAYFGVLHAFEPLLDNERSMRNRPAHVLDSGAKRQHNALLSERFEVSGKRTLATVKQPVGQVFYG